MPNVEAGVTGLTAQWKDGGDEIRSALPFVVAFVLVFAFLLMLVAFRSIVVAAKAIVLNCLSVAAAYGILVLVFQHGIGKGLLGFTSTAGISPVIPLLLFVILFGLSMDYHVFIVSRIRERFQRGDTMDEAISNGIKLDGGRRHQRGDRDGLRVRGLRDAVDAVLQAVRRRARRGDPDRRDDRPRASCCPASMKLLGERNWYLPVVARVAAALRRRRARDRRRAGARAGAGPGSRPQAAGVP